jgi:hypothetical protein
MQAGRLHWLMQLSESTHILVALIVLSAGWPLSQAWLALRRTSLVHALSWALLAWLAWVGAALGPLTDWPVTPTRYIALVLSACAVVATLGARRPGVRAWNFVTAGLLAVLLLPVLHQPWQEAGWLLEPEWALFLGGLLAVGVVNYVPTVLGGPAFFIGVIWFGIYLLHLVIPALQQKNTFAPIFCLIGVGGIWLADENLRKAAAAGRDQWRRFRNAYGLLWGLRAQEQFNRAATNGGLKVQLKWRRGLVFDPPASDAADVEKANALLAATLRPFLETD